MIRDLKYPEDARKVIDALHVGLRYDASIAVLGQGCSQLPVSGTPDFTSASVRASGIEEDKAVRREAVGLLSRFSFISMVSRYENHARLLLLQRRFLEEVRDPARRIGPNEMWNVIRCVNLEMRQGPVIVTSQYLVEHPSAALGARMKWLEGTYKVRNCLAHRLGIVEMIDVKPPREPIQNVKDTDTLKAVWLKVKMLVDGREVSLPYQHGAGQGQGEIKFEEYEREWKIGEVIHITPQDCQNVAMSLSLLGTQVLAEFEQEMNSMLAKPAAQVQSSPRTQASRNQTSEPAGPSSPRSEQLETHFADFKFKRGTDVGVRLPTGHQWVCNASLPSWHRILDTGLLEHLPSIYLCERHAAESGLQW
jgi:hypothetical protein